MLQESRRQRGATPKHLFRFRRTGGSLAFTLREIAGELWCAYASILNDPFDGMKFAPQEMRTVRLPEPADTRNPSSLPLEVVKQWAVSCFTEEWSSPTMWAHYADNYTGLCLVYSFDALYAYLEQKNRELQFSREWIAHRGGHNLDAEIERTFHLLRVQYIDRFPDSFNSVLEAIVSKTTHWAHEREWRLATQGRMMNKIGDTAGTVLDFPPKYISEIICGPKMDLSTLRTIVAARDAVNADCTVSRVKVSANGLSLIKETYTNPP